MYFDLYFFFFNDTATTEIYTLSLHDALPISHSPGGIRRNCRGVPQTGRREPRRVRRPETTRVLDPRPQRDRERRRSEEHTSELQSRQYLVCRLLLEKKKTKNTKNN